MAVHEEKLKDAEHFWEYVCTFFSLSTDTIPKLEHKNIMQWLLRSKNQGGVYQMYLTTIIWNKMWHILIKIEWVAGMRNVQAWTWFQVFLDLKIPKFFDFCAIFRQRPASSSFFTNFRLFPHNPFSCLMLRYISLTTFFFRLTWGPIFCMLLWPPRWNFEKSLLPLFMRLECTPIRF